jgi:proline iminopeptidase
LLDVGDGNHVYWETSGNPVGKPAVLVHGGPGIGTHPNMRRRFDPARYRIILFDQRGCGRTKPHARDPSADMSVNTTDHLIADMERLREHLDVDRWLVTGGSWGSTLALAYTERYRSRVTEIVLTSIMMCRRYEIDWLYRGAARFFPQEWQQFRAGVPPVDRGGDLVAAYARLMEHPDEHIRIGAATAWCAWEDSVVSLEPNGKPNFYCDRPPESRLAFVRIAAHYFAHGAWLADGQVLRDAGRLAGIPGVVIHGRLDLSCPLDSAWELTRAWPEAQLITPGIPVTWGVRPEPPRS